MNLQQADLLRRSKELDAREEFLDAKLKELESAPISLSVYESRVNVKEKQLANLEEKIKESANKLDKLDRDFSFKFEDNQTKKKEMELQVLKHQDVLEDVTKKVIAAKEELDKVNDLVSERKAYYDAQEADISFAERIGNEKLLELQDSIKHASKELNVTKELYEAQKENLDAITLKFMDHETNIELQIAAIEERKKNTELDIKDIEQKLRVASLKLEKVTQDVDAKLAKLNEKELSITAKRDEYILLKQEVATEKRRWESQKSMYGDMV